jgi:hypothetical protein
MPLYTELKGFRSLLHTYNAIKALLQVHCKLSSLVCPLVSFQRPIWAYDICIIPPKSQNNLQF